MVGFLLKDFPYMFWHIDLLEKILEAFQDHGYINRGSVQSVSYHQIPYNLYCITSQKYNNFAVLLLIMSTSTQNIVPDANAQRTPFKLVSYWSPPNQQTCLFPYI